MSSDSRLLQFEKGERLLSNPKIGDIKRKSFEALVLEAFIVNAPNGINKETIFSHCSDADVPDISELLICDILASLERDKNIRRQEDTYYIDGAFLSDLNNRIELAGKNITALLEIINSRILSKIEVALEEVKVSWVNRLIHAVLNDVFKTYAESLISVYAGKPSIIPTDLLDIIINRRALDLEVEEYECNEYVEILKDTLVEQFHDPHPDFARGIREIANRMIIMRTLANNPDVKFVGEELFEKAVLFIDNNVLISLLCPDTPFHNITKGLITETKKLKGTVILTDWTEEEWFNSIDHATRLFEGQSQATDAESVTNEIIGSFLLSGRPRKEWVDYVNELNEQYSQYKDEVLFKYQTEPKEFMAVEVNELKSKLNNYLNRHTEVIRHDAKMLLLTQERRTVTEATIGTTWFLSRDTKLRTTENDLMKKIDFDFESIMPLEIWFEILLPFCQSEGVFEETMDFTKLIGSRIIPIPANLVERYVGYLSVRVNVEGKDIIALKQITGRRHLRRAIETAISCGDFEGATNLVMEELKLKLEEEQDIETKKATIRRMSAKIRTLDTGILKGYWDAKKFGFGLKSVNTAKTNVEKGKTLENFTKTLFDFINGFMFIKANVRLEVEEIDLIFANSVFLPWGDPLVIECKNWSSKVGKNEIVLFKDKLKTLDAKTGILIVMSGITGGDEYHDARGAIRDAMREGKHIVPITLKQIQALSSIQEWYDLLQNSWYLPYRME